MCALLRLTEYRHSLIPTGHFIRNKVKLHVNTNDKSTNQATATLCIHALKFEVSMRTWKEATSEAANTVLGSRVVQRAETKKEKIAVVDFRGQRSDCRTS